MRTALLHGTSAAPAAESQAALSEGVHAAAFASVTESLASFRWAQAVLLSRAHSGDGKPLALVPGLDLLNHAGPEASAAVRFRDDSFELIALRDLAAGDAVEIDYGPRASHRLLRLYGFVPEEAVLVSSGSVDHTPVSGDAQPGEVHGEADQDEIQLALLPTAAELQGAPEAVRQQVEAARQALTACGIPGSSLRLRLLETGEVALPSAFQTVDTASPEAEVARHVLLSAVARQQQRQEQGSAACSAVKRAGMPGPNDEAVRERARLCGLLHVREAAVLERVAVMLKKPEGAKARKA